MHLAGVDNRGVVLVDRKISLRPGRFMPKIKNGLEDCFPLPTSGFQGPCESSSFFSFTNHARSAKQWFSWSARHGEELDLEISEMLFLVFFSR